MENGRDVLIDGLQQRPDLNGQIGTLLVHYENTDRWRVRVGGECLSIKTGNLRPYTFTAPPNVPGNLKTIAANIAGNNAMYKLDFKDLAREISSCDLGRERREVKDNLIQGVFVGLNIRFFQEPGADKSGCMACIFVGDEFTRESERLERAHGLVKLPLDADAPPRQLPVGRFFPIGKYAMEPANPPLITYYAFTKEGHAPNPAALLLPMVLTDTVYDADEIVAIYARLRIRA